MKAAEDPSTKVYRCDRCREHPLSYRTVSCIVLQLDGAWQREITLCNRCAFAGGVQPMLENMLVIKARGLKGK